MEESRPPNRIAGFDLARAVAIFGMVVHHFVIVMAREDEHPRWLSKFLLLFDGRPAALFLVLAGVGITLRTRRAVESHDPTLIVHERSTLAKRGFLLLILGFLNLFIWPGDILRVYGVSLLMAVRLISATGRCLISAVSIFVIGFGVMVYLFDYEQNWDWSTMTYHGLWTQTGMIRNLFFDGFRSVFPWSGFLVFGMWLGRLNLQNRQMNARTLVMGLVIMITAEIISELSLWHSLTDPLLDLSEKADVTALFGTTSMPPFPLFLTAAGGLAVAIIAICVRVADAFSRVTMVSCLVTTGKMALTWYFAHIYLGLGLIVAFHAAGNQSLPFAIAMGGTFFAIAVGLSCLWSQRFQTGPLESAMRFLTG